MTNRNVETTVFERIVPMTTVERELVKKWVEEGNSPFTNPFGLINLDGGSMLNFIQAMKEKPFVDMNCTKSAKRYGMPEIVCLEELKVEGWEDACEGMYRARI